MHYQADRVSKQWNEFHLAGFEADEAGVTMVPQNTVEVDADTGRKLLKMYDLLDEHDDVQNVYANFDLPEELLQEMEG